MKFFVYRTDQDDRALALVGAGMGVALMPAIFDAPNVKKVPVRDFDAKRVISARSSRLDVVMSSMRKSTGSTVRGQKPLQASGR